MSFTRCPAHINILSANISENISQCKQTIALRRCPWCLLWLSAGKCLISCASLAKFPARFFFFSFYQRTVHRETFRLRQGGQGGQGGFLEQYFKNVNPELKPWMFCSSTAVTIPKVDRSDLDHPNFPFPHFHKVRISGKQTRSDYKGARQI